MPSGSVPGHALAQQSVDGYAQCLCGWRAPALTKRERRAAYAPHIAEARERRRTECRDCGGTKLPRDMSRAKPGLCKTCSTARTRAWAEANPDEWERHRRRHNLRKKYGITPEDYDEMLGRQGGVCAICRTPPEDPRGYRMHVDHCHATGQVRGILCGSCNRGIGNLADDPARCEAAALYLRSTPA